MELDHGQTNCSWGGCESALKPRFLRPGWAPLGRIALILNSVTLRYAATPFEESLACVRRAKCHSVCASHTVAIGRAMREPWCANVAGNPK